VGFLSSASTRQQWPDSSFARLPLPPLPLLSTAFHSCFTVPENIFEPDIKKKNNA